MCAARGTGTLAAMIARLLVAPLLLATLVAVPTMPALAESVDDYPVGPVVEGPKKPRARAEHHVMVTGVAEAQASVTPAPGGRLRLRLSLRGKPGTTATAMSVRAAPCERWDPDPEAFVCRAGARRATLPLSQDAPHTASLTIAAPSRATDTIELTAGTAARPVLVWMVVPATAWRGPRAGRPFGGTLGDDGAGTVATESDISLTRDHRGRPQALGSVLLNNSGTRSRDVLATLRRCAAPVAACRLDTVAETSQPGFRSSPQPEGSQGLTWPARDGAALTLNAIGRPGGRVLATARMPWPDR